MRIDRLTSKLQLRYPMPNPWPLAWTTGHRAPHLMQALLEQQGGSIKPC
jgi:hypothetical protein